MAVYRCNECDNFLDDDWHPCELDVRDPSGLELLCPCCAADIEERVFEAHAELLSDSHALPRRPETEVNINNWTIVWGLKR